MSDSLQLALAGLARQLDAPRPSGLWQASVRQSLVQIRDGLARETPRARDGWAVARERTVLRERRALLRRLALVSPRVAAAEPVCRELQRLMHDVDHHHQRVNDIAWDEAEVDFGGSE